MNFCTNCGTKLEAHMAFCTGCGTRVGRTPAQQERLPHVQYDLYRPYAKNKKNYVIIAVIALFVLIGAALLFYLREDTGLVGAWEHIDTEVRYVFQFYRNQSGTMRAYINGQLVLEEHFSWEITRDGRLALTAGISGELQTEVVDFTVSGNVLVIEGEVFYRVGTRDRASPIVTPAF